MKIRLGAFLLPSAGATPAEFERGFAEHGRVNRELFNEHSAIIGKAWSLPMFRHEGQQMKRYVILAKSARSRTPRPPCASAVIRCVVRLIPSRASWRRCWTC